MIDVQASVTKMSSLALLIITFIMSPPIGDDFVVEGRSPGSLTHSSIFHHKSRKKEKRTKNKF
jgi:hypothetical protein